MSKPILQITVLIALTVALGVSTRAEATNTPCSGHKGGIDHCQGLTFICNDDRSARVRNHVRFIWAELPCSDRRRLIWNRRLQ